MPEGPLSSAGRVEATPHTYRFYAEASAEFALPERQLVQWLTDDASSVDFAIIWTIATVPFSTMSDRLGLVALMFVPPIIRLGQRALAFRRLVQGGMPAADIRNAFAWAEDGDRVPPAPTGWRNLLASTRRMSGWMLVIATVILMVWMELSPWKFSRAAQTVFADFFRSYILMAKLTAGLFVLDAVLRPRPIWQEFRRHSRRGWRRLLMRYIPATPPTRDCYDQAADREIERLLSE